MPITFHGLLLPTKEPLHRSHPHQLMRNRELIYREKMIVSLFHRRPAPPSRRAVSILCSSIPILTTLKRRIFKGRQDPAHWCTPEAYRWTDFCSLILILPMTCLHPTSIPDNSSISKVPSTTRTIMSTVDIELAPQSMESPTRGFALVASKIDSDIDKQPPYTDASTSCPRGICSITRRN
jgi:hypothetical protein